MQGIPIKYMTIEAAKKMCNVMGEVFTLADPKLFDGGHFIHVQVSIDLSLPLCHGRLISLGDGKQVWVSFKYAQLPNICYWCGQLTHDDRVCELWIESEGTLTPEQHESGPNLRAPPFVASRKNVITVPGFYAAKKKMNAENTVDRNSSQHSGSGRENVPEQPQKEMASSEAENNSPSMRNTFGGVNWAETVIQNQTDTVIIEELKSPNEFETALKDINEEIGLAEEFGSTKKSFKNPDALDNLICHVHLKQLGFMIQKKTNVFSQPRHKETEYRPVTIQQRLYKLQGRKD